MGIKVNTNIVQHLLKRLYLKQKKSIYYDALIGKTSYKLDVSEFSLFGKDLALSFIQKVLLPGNHITDFVIDFNGVKNLTDFSKSIDVVDKIKKIYHQQNAFNTQQQNSFVGVGYPLIVLKTKTGKLKVAPLIIWPITINKIGASGQAFSFTKNDQKSPFLNNTILSSLENYKDASLDDYMNSFNPKEISKNYLASYCEGLMKYLNPNQEDRKDGYYGLQFGNPAQIKQESYYQKKTGASIWFEWSGVMSLFEFKNPHFIKQLKDLDANSLPKFNKLHLIHPTTLISYLDDEQSKVLSSKANLNIINGAAGTGKTDVLCAKISQLILNNYSSVVVSQKASALGVIKKRLNAIELPFVLLLDDQLSINNFKEKFQFNQNYTSQDLEKYTNKLKNCEWKINDLEKKFVEIQNIYERDIYNGKNYATILEDLKSLEWVNNDKTKLQNHSALSEEDFILLNENITSISDFSIQCDYLNFLKFEEWGFNGFSLFEISLKHLQKLSLNVEELDVLLTYLINKKIADFKIQKQLLTQEILDIKEEIHLLSDKPLLKPTSINKLLCKVSSKIKLGVANYTRNNDLKSLLINKNRAASNIYVSLENVQKGILDKAYFTNEIISKLNQINTIVNKMQYFNVSLFENNGSIDVENVKSLVMFLTNLKPISSEEVYKIYHLKKLLNKYNVSSNSKLINYHEYFNLWKYQSLKNSISSFQEKILEINHKTLEKYQLLKKESVALAKKIIKYQYYLNCQHQIDKIELEKGLSIHHLLKNITSKEDINKFSLLYPELFKTIFPIVLCSPEYYKFQSLNYDVLFLEEASQLKLEKTYTYLFYHQQIFVFGDENQMPPYDFFETEAYLKEEISEEDKQFVLSESFLDFSMQLVHSKFTLNRFYRSTSPDLIRFSNEMFYKNELVFPFNDTNSIKNSNVILIHEIVENKGVVNGTNEAEINKIIELLLLESCKYTSIGIITLNKSQRNFVIEKLIKENLYNDNISVMSYDEVQGDEFDCVFISFVYSFEDANWGVLNRFYADRILNVLFTRAKKQLHIITSINLNRAFSELTKGQDLNVGKRVLFSFLCARNRKSNAVKMLDFDVASNDTFIDFDLNNTSKSYKNVIFKINFLKSYKHIWSYQKLL